MSGSRFGQRVPDLCIVCHRAELKFLECPRAPEDHMVRTMHVRIKCLRCDECASRCCTEEDTHIAVKICLPTSLIADATSFAEKHRSSSEWGIKPSCADLQLTNLLCAEQNAFRRRAYLVVGIAAIRDELVFKYEQIRWFERFACWLGRRRPLPATAWTQLDAHGQEEREVRLPPKEDPKDRWKAEEVNFHAQREAHQRRVQEEHQRLFGADNHHASGQANAIDSQSVSTTPGEGTASNYTASASPTALQDLDAFIAEGLAIRQANDRAQEALELAEVATTIEEQQRAYVEGGTLQSSTVVMESSGSVTPPPGLEGLQSGDREAVPRFPQLTNNKLYLHGNNPENLQAAHDMRNIGVGDHNPFVSEQKTKDALTAALKEHVFTPANCKRAMHEFESIRDSSLPKKMSELVKERTEFEAFMAELPEGKEGFSTTIKAFVKSEVSGKNKPRPIANHGEVRLYALAKVAYVFEHVMFQKLRNASIKECTKSEAIEKIMTNFSDMRDGARWVENDLTAFEFGISEQLKQIEMQIFRHIAKIVGISEVGELFERVVEDRDKVATWKMKFTDKNGEKRTFRFKLPQTMRESGDRVTSSGNFLQNLVAWFSYLVDPEHVEDALKCLLKFSGAKMFYVSPRDKAMVDGKDGKKVRRKYLCKFAFEGDDTVARFEEEIWAKDKKTPCPVEAFFKRWGWRSKLVWKEVKGHDYVRFVGYEALILDGKVEFDGGDVVMTPETHRFLNTKSWTATKVSPAELKTCIRVFAANLAKGFRKVEPMHSFLTAMYDDNDGGAKIDAQLMKTYFLDVHGVLPDHGTTLSASIAMPPFEAGDSTKWKKLLSCAAGPFTDYEWATMSHIGTVRTHGADLALSIPASWRA